MAKTLPTQCLYHLDKVKLTNVFFPKDMFLDLLAFRRMSHSAQYCSVAVSSFCKAFRDGATKAMSSAYRRMAKKTSLMTSYA